MKVKKEYTICDVCGSEKFKEVTEIHFSYDNKSFKFDCCYECMRGDRMKNVYKKVCDLINKYAR